VKQIVEFRLESGDSIFVEVDELGQTEELVSLSNKVAQKAQQTFESALDKIKPLTNAIMTKLRSLNEPADEVEVKFGIKMSAELGAVIASGNGEINYEITLKWQRNKSVASGETTGSSLADQT
jgi:Trypsin-co-occurring domain 1